MQEISISMFYTPWRFYLQILSPELYSLYDSIDEFTSLKSNHLSIPGDLEIGVMCLARLYGQYNRAKVLAIECKPGCDIIVSVFFVDLGEAAELPMNDLLAIPKHLIDKEPFQVGDDIVYSNYLFNCSFRFQAVLCSLIGVRPTNNNTDWDPDLCTRIYDEIIDPCKNMAIRPVKGRSGPKSDLGISSYNCILVDMDDDDQTSTLNNKLISNGLACFELADYYHLKLNRYPLANTNILDSDDSDTLENWDNENYQRPQNGEITPESRNSDEDGVRLFDYNFTDDEINDVMLSLVSHVCFNNAQRIIRFFRTVKLTVEP